MSGLVDGSIALRGIDMAFRVKFIEERMPAKYLAPYMFHER